MKPSFLLIVLIVGLVLFVRLVGTRLVFQSKASSEAITFSGENVKEDNGQLFTTSPTLTIEILSSFGPPEPPRVLGVNTKILSDPKPTTISDLIDSILNLFNLARQPDYPDRALEPQVIEKIPAAPDVIPIPTPQPPTAVSMVIPIPVSTASSQATSAAEINYTLGFKIAESLIDLDTKPFLIYNRHPQKITYTFSKPEPGVKTIFAQFKAINGARSQVFSKSIELRASDSASAP